MTDPTASDVLEEEDDLEAELNRRLGHGNLSQSVQSFDNTPGIEFKVPRLHFDMPEITSSSQAECLPGSRSAALQIESSPFDAEDNEMELEVMRRCAEASNVRADPVAGFEQGPHLSLEAADDLAGTVLTLTQSNFDESVPHEMELELQRRLQAQMAESQGDGRLVQPSQAGFEVEEGAPEIDMDDVEDYLALQGCGPEVPEDSEEEYMECGQDHLGHSTASGSYVTKRAGNVSAPHNLTVSDKTRLGDGPLSKRAKTEVCGQIKATEAKQDILNSVKSAAADDLLNQIFSEDEDVGYVEEHQTHDQKSKNIPRLLAMDIQGPCISVTSVLSGCRVYCTKSDAGDDVERADARRGKPAQFNSFLDNPVSVLIRQLDDEKLAQVITKPC
jgi:hypothetical protein